MIEFIKKYKNFLLAIGALIVLTCLFCAMFWEGLQQGIIANWDSLRGYLPLRFQAWQIFTDYKQFPFWTSVDALGAPFFADCQTGSISPFNILFSFFSVGFTFNLTIILHYVFAGFGTYIFLKKWNCAFEVALFGAIAFMFSGFLITNKEILALGFGACYLPWFLVAVESILSNKSRIGFLSLIFLIFLQFIDGHVQIFLYTGYFIFAYSFFRVFILNDDKIKKIIIVSLGFILGILLLSISFFPATQLANLSLRSASSFAFACQGQLDSFFELFSMIFPYIEGPAWSTSSIYETVGKQVNVFRTVILYSGIAPLFLALAGLIWAQNKNNKKVIAFFIIAALLCIALSLGNNIPFLKFACFLPGIKTFRQPHRCIFILNFCVAVAGAISLNELIKLKTKKIKIGIVIASFLFFQVALLYFIKNPNFLINSNFFPNWINKISFNIPNVYIPLLLIFATTLLGCFCFIKKIRKFVGWIFLVLIIVDAFYFVPYFAPQAGVKYSDINSALQLNKINNIEKPRYLPRYGAFNYLNKFHVGWSEISKLSALPVFAHYTAFVQKNWYAFAKHHERGKYSDKRFFDANHFLRHANIKYANYKNLIFNKEVNHPFNNPTYETANFFPRAFLTTDLLIFNNNSEAKNALFNDKFKWPSNKTITLAKTDSVIENWPKFLSDATGSCKIISYTPNKINIEVDIHNGPMMLVISDAWYPNWRAKIDGDEVGIAKADCVLRAIAVPVGKHNIKFYYRSNYFVVGGIISLVVLGISIFCFCKFEKLLFYIEKIVIFLCNNKLIELLKSIKLSFLIKYLTIGFLLIFILFMVANFFSTPRQKISLVNNFSEKSFELEPGKHLMKKISLDLNSYYKLNLELVNNDKIKPSCIFDVYASNWDIPETQITGINQKKKIYSKCFKNLVYRPNAYLRLLNTSLTNSVFIKKATFENIYFFERVLQLLLKNITYSIIFVLLLSLNFYIIFKK